MTQITAKGRELASKLEPSVDPTFPTDVLYTTCSLICRHATTHGRLQETACNRELRVWEAKQDVATEARIAALVAQLPLVNGQPIRVKFDSDPRGYTVKLIMPDGRHDTWGGAEEGLGVPQ